MDKGSKLIEELAQFKHDSGYIVWTQIPLGSMSMSGGRIPRADVFAMRKSYTNPCPTIYEVKVSRPDFLSDVSRGKYRSYFPYCSQLFFAAPSGLINKGDVPDDCGLILKGENGWHVVVAARRREIEFDREMLLKLLIEGFCQQQDGWKQYERLKMAAYPDLKRHALLWGKSIAKEFQSAEALVEQQYELLEKISKAVGREFKTLDSAIWQLRGEVDELLQKRKYLKETIELADLVMRLWQGTLFFVDNVPKKLREIAERLEIQIDDDKKPRTL